MTEKFAEMLTAGGKTNSLGRTDEVIELVLQNKSRLAELYDCLLHEDAWVRMRAVDALEKVCRQHPDWLAPYIDKIQTKLGDSAQPSIQWHLAQIYAQVDLTAAQKQTAISWLKNVLSTKDVDWIVAANAMDTLMQFTQDDSFPVADMLALLEVQTHHKSNAVVRRATKHLAVLSPQA